jgi:acyl-CoA-dependent ceramide synthase
MSSYTSALLAAYMPARLQPFVSVSYPVWGSEHGHRVQLYRKGRNDINFVLFITIFFSLFRHFVMVYVLSPIAHRFVRVEAPPIHAGLDKATKERRLRTLARRKEHAAIRFAEQGWSMMYCLVTETIGLVSVNWWGEAVCGRALCV